MEAHVERQFAIGPVSPEIAVESDDGWSKRLEVGNASWVVTSSRATADRIASALGEDFTLVKIDCWNSFGENRTMARLTTERREGGKIDVAHTDRSYGSLARAGVLASVTTEWLVAHVKRLRRVIPEVRPSRRELRDRERAGRLLEHLVARGRLELADGSSIGDLVEPSRRILAVVLKRPEIGRSFERMLTDSRHVAELYADAHEIVSTLEAVKSRRTMTEPPR